MPPGLSRPRGRRRSANLGTLEGAMLRLLAVLALGLCVCSVSGTTFSTVALPLAGLNRYAGATTVTVSRGEISKHGQYVVFAPHNADKTATYVVRPSIPLFLPAESSFVRSSPPLRARIGNPHSGHPNKPSLQRFSGVQIEQCNLFSNR
jgi:hypothetical protein